MSEYINLAVPFFSQRENIYTWHEVVTKVKWDAINKKNVKYEEIVHPGISMACQSCSITSLCMILQYLGISDDSPDDAMKKIYEEFFFDKTSGKNGYNWILRGENLAKVLTEIYSVEIVNISAVPKYPKCI